MFALIALWLSNLGRWTASRTRRLSNWLTWRNLLVAYLAWLIATLGVAILLGGLFNSFGIAIACWGAFGVLVPFLVINRVRWIIVTLFGIIVVGAIIRMSGVAPGYIAAFAGLATLLALTPFRDIPGVRLALVAGLILVALAGTMNRLLPVTYSALGLAKSHVFEQTVSVFVGGPQLFDKNGMPLSKVNVRTGEIFWRDRVAFNNDPRTGESLKPLTGVTQQSLLGQGRGRQGPKRADSSRAGRTLYENLPVPGESGGTVHRSILAGNLAGVWRSMGIRSRTRSTEVHR